MPFKAAREPKKVVRSVVVSAIQDKTIRIPI
jgi:hypothetical protein